jgi:hypothetical protein
MMYKILESIDNNLIFKPMNYIANKFNLKKANVYMGIQLFYLTLIVLVLYFIW